MPHKSRVCLTGTLLPRSNALGDLGAELHSADGSVFAIFHSPESPLRHFHNREVIADGVPYRTVDDPGASHFQVSRVELAASGPEDTIVEMRRGFPTFGVVEGSRQDGDWELVFRSALGHYFTLDRVAIPRGVPLSATLYPIRRNELRRPLFWISPPSPSHASPASPSEPGRRSFSGVLSVSGDDVVLQADDGETLVLPGGDAPYRTFDGHRVSGSGRLDSAGAGFPLREVELGAIEPDPDLAFVRTGAPLQTQGYLKPVEAGLVLVTEAGSVFWVVNDFDPDLFDLTLEVIAYPVTPSGPVPGPYTAAVWLEARFTVDVGAEPASPAEDIYFVVVKDGEAAGFHIPAGSELVCNDVATVPNPVEAMCEIAGGLADGKPRIWAEPRAEDATCIHYFRSPREEIYALRPAPPMIGRFRVLRELHRGSRGILYLAEDTESGGLAAARLLPWPGGLAASEALALYRKFEEDARTLNIFHDHVQPLWAMGEIDFNPYIVTRYIEGFPVSRFLGAPVSLLFGFLDGIASALARCHGWGIIHGDLKPSRVWVEKPGTGFHPGTGFYLRGTGLKKLIGDAFAAAGRTQPPLGTSAYQSPEERHWAPLTAASDQYALAQIVRPLFAASDDVNEVLQRATATDPSRRYSSCLHFVEALRAAHRPGEPS